MYRKFYVSLLALVLALAVFALTAQQSLQTATAAPHAPASPDLLGSLPSSDFILYVDAQRAMTDIIPNILMTSPEQRARFDADLDKFMKETGLDPRLLDAVAIGMKLNSSTRAHDADFAIIVRGRFDANATIDAGFAAAIKESGARMERQSQQYEGRTIHLLAPVKSSQRSSANVAPAVNEDAKSETGVLRATIESGETRSIRIEAGSGTSMAAVALDSNTIALGQLKSVRATIDASMGRERVSDELVQLATRTPGAVVSFSGNVKPEMAASFRFGGGGEQATNSLASIRQVYGSFNTTGSDAEASINIRTEAAESTRQLSMMLNALKFAARLGSAQTSGKGKSFEALIKGTNINAVGNELQITVKVAQTDLAPFVHHF